MKLDDVIQHVPETVREIIELIGLHATETLIEAIGGTTFPFGKGQRETERLNKLKRLLGDATAQKLTDYFCGEDVYLPRCEKALRMLKKAQFRADINLLMAADHSATRAVEELCPKYNISDRTAWKWLREENTQQRELF